MRQNKQSLTVEFLSSWVLCGSLRLKTLGFYERKDIPRECREASWCMTTAEISASPCRESKNGVPFDGEEEKIFHPGSPRG
jgi:hypothetical protein